MSYTDLKTKLKSSFVQQMQSLFLPLRNHTYLDADFVESHF